MTSSPRHPPVPEWEYDDDSENRSDALSLVEALVRKHDEAAGALRPVRIHRPSVALSSQSLNIHFFEHCSMAARSGAGALLSSLWHLWVPGVFTFLAPVVASVCVAPTVGATMMKSLHSAYVAVLVPVLALAALLIGSPVSPSVFGYTASTALALISFLVVLASPPPTTRKLVIALSTAAVFRTCNVVTSSPKVEGTRTAFAATDWAEAIILILNLMLATVTGVVSQLAAALPFPRTAHEQMRREMRAAAAGIALHVEAVVAAMTGETDPLSDEFGVETRRWREAVTQALASASTHQGDAAYETPFRCASTMDSRQEQLQAIKQMAKLLGKLSDAQYDLRVAIDGADGGGAWKGPSERPSSSRPATAPGSGTPLHDHHISSSGISNNAGPPGSPLYGARGAVPTNNEIGCADVCTAVQVLRALGPQLQALCACSRSFAQIIGRFRRPEVDAARLASEVEEVLKSLDAAFFEARLVYIYLPRFTAHRLSSERGSLHARSHESTEVKPAANALGGTVETWDGHGDAPTGAARGGASLALFHGSAHQALIIAEGMLFLCTAYARVLRDAALAHTKPLKKHLACRPCDACRACGDAGAIGMQEGASSPNACMASIGISQKIRLALRYLLSFPAPTHVPPACPAAGGESEGPDEWEMSVGEEAAQLGSRVVEDAEEARSVQCGARQPRERRRQIDQPSTTSASMALDKSGRVASKWAKHTRVKGAARLSIALLAACAVTWPEQRGVWAGITVAMVMELGAGASFRASLLRLQGSVIGAFFAVAAVYAASRLDAVVYGAYDSLGASDVNAADAAGSGDSVMKLSDGRDALRLGTLIVLYVGFAVGCGFVRASVPQVSYAALVAHFTAAIVLMGPECGGLGARCEVDRADAENFSFDRIQYTLVGLAIVAIASLCIFPIDSRASARHALADGAAGLRLLWAETHEHWLAKSLLVDGVTFAEPQLQPSRGKPIGHRAPEHHNKEHRLAACGSLDVISSSGYVEMSSQPHLEMSSHDCSHHPGSRCSDVRDNAAATARMAENASSRTPRSSGNTDIGACIPHSATATSLERALSDAKAEARARIERQSTSTRLRDSTSPRLTAESLVTSMKVISGIVNRRLSALPILIDEADATPACWRAPYAAPPAKSVLKAMRAVLDALDTMQMTNELLGQGEARVLLRPLTRPLNRLELMVAQGLQRLEQKLRLSGARVFRGPGKIGGGQGQEPLYASVHSTLRLLEDCYGAVIRSLAERAFSGRERAFSGRERSESASVWAANDDAAAAAAAAVTATPPVTNRDVLGFNARVYAVRLLAQRMIALDAAINEMHVHEEPFDLRSVVFA